MKSLVINGRPSPFVRDKETGILKPRVVATGKVSEDSQGRQSDKLVDARGK